MKKIGKIAAGMAVCIIGASFVPVSAAAGPSECGALRVEGTQLVDENGSPIQLKGLSTHGIAWFPQYVNEAAFQEFHEQWNANVIRLAMYTAEYNGYCTGGDKEQLRQLIRDGVNYAKNQDMYVIVDWHILSDQNPQQNKEEAKNFFAEMTAEFGDTDHILYEICNEPNGGTSWADIKAYAEEVIPVIREHDKDAIIIIGTPNWSQYVDQAAADPITGHENLMYTLHYYAATHKDDLRQKMKDAVNAGLPIFVSEYGICDASGNGAIDLTQANAWVEAMDELGISYVGWNISNKNETSAIFKQDCQKVSGFTEEDLSPSGTWLYHMLNGETDQVTEEEIQVGETGMGSEYIQYQAQVKNSWQAEGKTFYQYDLTLENTSDAPMDAWAVEVKFSEDISLSDGWNGDYSVHGDTLSITSKDYNGAMDAGGQVKDIGFIISAGPELALAE